MKFSEIEYKRPDIEQLKGQMTKAISRIEGARSAREQNEWITHINELRKSYDTMENLCYIRHSIDTQEPFYDKEQDFFDESGPEIAAVVQRFYEAVLASEFLDELKTLRPPHFFNLAEVRVKTFSDTVMGEMQRENQLISSYDKIIASAEIDYDGKQLSLAQLGPYLTHRDREIRKSSHEALNDFMASREDEFDRIFDELVHLRHAVAVKLGYQNYVELGYKRLARTDYTQEEIEKFRNAVHRDITPLGNRLMKRQQERIGVDSLYYYDLGYSFKSGNPIPSGDDHEIVQSALEMYNELSVETGDFFQEMKGGGFMDLAAKKSKAAGGYCTFIQDFRMPFIFSNFNGTYHDVTVLTHEFGHAFQVYSGREIEEIELIWPTYEAAEIFSMGMEFITWPWMGKFFNQDEEKFKFMHLSDGLKFIPYGTAVDEFQHRIYENPELSPDQRKKIWRAIEKKYMPYRNYKGNAYLEGGGFWHRQGHIFQVPFYYIDYALAQISAFELKKKFQDNPGETWQDYLNMCAVSGSRPYSEILRAGKLSNPFETDTIKDIIRDIEMSLDQIDDSDF